ncbi:hypothetical protein EF847_09570 [Actinobacteria bacterium YIM 96077]|uniref:Uncharacterized protein n=2 Tax=Phytoactinopolyspora halophila TaxID=1981511 RepID=A0A329QAN4_9ACTN|nr:hypothetical protein EF847_09570 [Actinobacteria bacterium YIM 96077]RAW09287.1 hypothetical protein DPM12_21780 [Phytoactinopolyspora halophila]
MVMIVAISAGTSACTDDDGGDGSSRLASEGPGAGDVVPGLSQDEIQRILDDARFSGEGLDLMVKESYERESGLRATTLAYCDGEPDSTDQLRLARSQRWWHNEAWPHPDDGGYLVGVEVVLYEHGGAGAAMASFADVPHTCPSAEYSSGATATFDEADVDRASLPWGAVALRDEWTYPDGMTTSGLIVAVPVKDLVGFLYIRGHEQTVRGRFAELAATLERNLDQAARELEAASTDGG